MGRRRGQRHPGHQLFPARGAPLVNLRDARIVLRPRGLSDVLDLALRACVTLHRPLFLRLTALMAAAPLSGLFTIAAGQLLFAEEVRVGDVFRRWLGRLGGLVSMLVLWRVVAVATTVMY